MYQYLKKFVFTSILILTMGCIDKKESQLQDGDILKAFESNTIEVTVLDLGQDISTELVINQANSLNDKSYIHSVTRTPHAEDDALGHYSIKTLPNIEPATYEVSRKTFTLKFAFLSLPLPITSPTIQFRVEKEGLEVKHNGKTYFTVITHNKVWLDRNLGAASTQCQTDFSRCQGDFFAWQPGFASTQGAVCPIGFRVPTIDELERLFSTIKNRDDALLHNLAIPTVGYRLHNDFLHNSDTGTVFPAVSHEGSGTGIVLLPFINDVTFDEAAFNGGSPSCNRQNHSVMFLPSRDQAMFLPPGDYALMPSPGTAPGSGPTCPTTPSPISSEPLISMGKHTLLWSSTRNNHGHAYIYFSENHYGSEYNSGHARFQVRCIKH